MSPAINAPQPRSEEWVKFCYALAADYDAMAIVETRSIHRIPFFKRGAQARRNKEMEKLKDRRCSAAKFLRW